MSLRAKCYVGVVIASGLAAVVAGVTHWQSSGLGLFASILLLGAIASILKVTIAGNEGSMSMNFIFIMLAVARLGLGESLCVGVCSSLLQTFWRPKNHANPIQAVFNVSLIAALIGVSHTMFHQQWLCDLLPGSITRLLLVSIVYFVLNTGTVAGIISITTNQSIVEVWKNSYSWSWIYYLLGASAVGGFNLLEKTFGLEMALLVLPIAFLGFSSYRMRIESLDKSRKHAEEQRQHAEEVANVHLRTIRALALAIEAKDVTTGRHLHRVQTYALALGKELSLPEDELQALGAASILHDIGKIAVPEYIISKPGKLSKAEFDKMKVHPLVGGQIVESVRFPYPVAPIVSAHHEKWDGTGYPFGLKGEEIPLSARILAAVDCLDALASDRQYRRALPIDQAMDFVRSESGRAFDPKVVDLLSRRYQELEVLAHSSPAIADLQLSINARIDRGAAPDAGLEIGHCRDRRELGFGGAALERMAATLGEIRLLDGLGPLWSGYRPVPETMNALLTQLRDSIPFDAAALFLESDELLLPHFIQGADAEALRMKPIRIGDGLSGWVAEHRVPLLNGNPGVEFGAGGVPPSGFALRSALATPLETETGVLGVLTLYSRKPDAFLGNHLRLCMGLRTRLAFALQAGLAAEGERRVAGPYAGSGLPNTGALLQHLDRQLKQPEGCGSLTVIAIQFASGTSAESQQSRIQNLVSETCAPDAFLARVGEHEYVMVLQNAATSTLDLEARLAGEFSTPEGDAPPLRIGIAEAPAEAAEPETLISIAAGRLHPPANREAPAAATAHLAALSRATSSWRATEPAPTPRLVKHSR